MAKDPAFLFYPNDWIGGTMGMTFEEKGAYMEVLMMQFNRGHMGGHMIGQLVGQIWDKISHKFIQDEHGNWFNERLDEEIKRRKAFTESRRNNILGKNQHTNTLAHMDGHMTSHMENVNVNTNTSISVYKKEAKKFSFRDQLIKNGAEENLVDEWMDVRKKKKATNSETAFKGFMREVDKYGKGINEVLRICVEKSWKGFSADWVDVKEGKSTSKFEAAADAAETAKAYFKQKYGDD